MLKLLGKNKNPIGLLLNSKDLCIESDLKTGLKSLSFSFAINDELASKIEGETYIVTDNYEYIVKEINKEKNEWFSVYCKANIEALTGKPHLNFAALESTAADIIRLAILNTGWTVEEVDKITKKRTIRKDIGSAYDIVCDVQKVFMIDIEYDTLNKKVKIYNKKGQDRGVYFTDQLNLRQLKEQSSSYDFITRIIPIGKDDLRVTSVNGGKEYVDNFSYSNKIIAQYWQDKRYTDPQSLLDDAKAKLEEFSKPKRSYSANVYMFDSVVDLGDIITLIDSIKEVKEVQRVVKLKQYPYSPEKDTIEISNTLLSFSELQQQLEDSASIVDNITTDSGVVDGSKIENLPEVDTTVPDGSITTDKLAANAVTAGKIAAGAITADKITAGAVTAAKIEAGAITANSAIIADAAITTAKIGDAQITTAKIADAAIDSAKINRLDVQSAILKDAVIGTAQIADAAINNAKIGKLAVATANIQDAAITNAKIKDLNADKITAGDISADRLTANAIDAINMNATNATINTAKIGNLSADKITSGDISADRIKAKVISAINFSTENATIDAAKIGDLNADKITAGDISADRMKTNAIAAVNASIGDATINSAKIGDLDASKITTGTLDADRIKAGSITAGKINADAISSIAVSAGSVVAGDIESGKIKVGNINIVDGSISGAKITKASITNAQIDNAFIADAYVKNITADKIKGGTLDAKNINVTNLNANSITVGQINGIQIANGAISNDKLDSILSGTIKNTVDNVDKALDDIGLIKGDITTIANGKNSISYSTSAPSTTGKKENDIWYNTSDGYKMHYFKNNAWVATQFGTNAIIANAITADKLATNSVIAGKIAAGAVTTDKLYSLSVTSDKVAANAITAGKVAANAISAGNIVSGAVTSDKIVSKAITADKLDTDQLFVGDNAFINKLKAVEINAANITTGKISSDRLDITGLVSFESFNKDLQQVFDVTGDKTYINGGMIATNTIKADKIDLKSGINVKAPDGSSSFAISEDGNTYINGFLQSGNYVPGSTGYYIKPDGSAEFNQATIRGSIALPNAGITDSPVGNGSDSDLELAQYNHRNFLLSPMIVTDPLDPAYNSFDVAPPVGAVLCSYNPHKGTVKAGTDSPTLSWAVINLAELYKNTNDQNALDRVNKAASYMISIMQSTNFYGADFKYIPNEVTIVNGTWTPKTNMFHVRNQSLAAFALLHAYEITQNSSYKANAEALMDATATWYQNVDTRCGRDEIPSYMKGGVYNVVINRGDYFRPDWNIFSNTSSDTMLMLADKYIELFGDATRKDAEKLSYTVSEFRPRIKSYLTTNMSNDIIASTGHKLLYNFAYDDGSGVPVHMNYDFHNDVWGKDQWFTTDLECWGIRTFALCGLTDTALDLVNKLYDMRSSSYNDLILLFDRYNADGSPFDEEASVDFTGLLYGIHSLLKEYSVVSKCNEQLMLNTCIDTQIRSDISVEDGSYYWNTFLNSQSVTENKTLGEILYYTRGLGAFDMLNKARAAGTPSSPVRFWAGKPYSERNTAPFRVLQDGTLYATKGIYEGKIYGDYNNGYIHVHKDRIEINDTETPTGKEAICSKTPYVKLGTGLSTFNTNVSFGSDNVFYDKTNKLLKLNSTSFNIDNLFKVSSSKGIDLRDHNINTTSNTLTFDNAGTQGSNGDFAFTRKNFAEKCKVKIDGDLMINERINSPLQQIEMRSVKTSGWEGWGFYAN